MSQEENEKNQQGLEALTEYKALVQHYKDLAAQWEKLYWEEKSSKNTHTFPVIPAPQIPQLPTQEYPRIYGSIIPSITKIDIGNLPFDIGNIPLEIGDDLSSPNICNAIDVYGTDETETNIEREMNDFWYDIKQRKDNDDGFTQ